MAVDKVRPFKMETPAGGTETDMFQTEVDPTEDYISAKGVAFEDQDETRVFGDSGQMNFKDTDVTTEVTLQNLLDDHHSGWFRIIPSQTVTISARKEMRVKRRFRNRGTLINNGRLVVD